MKLKFSFRRMVLASRRISLATMRSGCESQQRADVDIPVVEEDPRVGRLARQFAFSGLRLDEVIQRRHILIDALVKTAVKDKGFRNAHGPHRDRAVRRSRDRRGRHRGGAIPDAVSVPLLALPWTSVCPGAGAARATEHGPRLARTRQLTNRALTTAPIRAATNPTMRTRPWRVKVRGIRLCGECVPQRDNATCRLIRS